VVSVFYNRQTIRWGHLFYFTNNSIGWIPAALWSVYALNQYKTDQKIAKAFKQAKVN
jgi:hypothetical protein